MLEGVIRTVKMDAKGFTILLVGASDAITIPRSKRIEVMVEFPRRFKYRVPKALIVLPVIVGCHLTMHDKTVQIRPSAKAIIAYCGHVASEDDDGISCFETIARCGFHDISLAFKWVFANYDKLNYFFDDGPGFLSLMIDNDFLMSSLKVNPFLAAHSKACSKAQMHAIESKSIEFLVELSTHASEITRFHLKDVMSSSGHVCFPIKFLYNIVTKQSKSTEVRGMSRENFRCMVSVSGYFVLLDEHVYLSYVYDVEQKIVQKIHASNRQLNPPISKFDTAIHISEFEAQQSIQFNTAQKLAIEQAFGSAAICIITGGGGTGKSKCVSCIQSICAARNLTIQLAAPTGMAANRLGKEAKTLHRLLKIVESEGGDGLAKSYEMLTCDVLVVDESGMLDLGMFWLLLKAINFKFTKLVLLGDPHQLPPIRHGQVLADLINSTVVPCVELKKVFRQDKDSTILKLAKNVLKKRMPPKSHFQSIDVDLLEIADESQIQRHVVDLYQKNPGLVIIIPTKKGDVGTRSINNVLRAVLFDDIPATAATFNVGLKVICCRNTYVKNSSGEVDVEKSVYNGQIGVVVKTVTRTDEVVVAFDSGQTVQLPDKNLDMAYALTVHKVQGSEYPHTCLIFHETHNMMLYDQIFYTAITRAQTKMTIISNMACIKRCIMTSGSRRISLLCQLLSAVH